MLCAVGVASPELVLAGAGSLPYEGEIEPATVELPCGQIKRPAVTNLVGRVRPVFPNDLIAGVGGVAGDERADGVVVDRGGGLRAVRVFRDVTENGLGGGGDEIDLEAGVAAAGDLAVGATA